MGEHILRLAIGELKTIRVRCAKCRMVSELSVMQLSQMRSACPHCGIERFVNHEQVQAWRDLQSACHVIGQMETVSVEFPIKLDDGK